ncbi:MAG: hypothetical protein Ct9H300mP28_11700 [Pseudomonadota bacterium]|nr:MAG: hypothetical protein Ct9H300mP28_11700 [Pseudomonadota bacterium]
MEWHSFKVFSNIISAVSIDNTKAYRILGWVLLFIVLILKFFLMHLAPGDIADTIAIDAGGADEEMMDAIRKDYGLDLPSGSNF